MWVQRDGWKVGKSVRAECAGHQAVTKAPLNKCPLQTVWSDIKGNYTLLWRSHSCFLLFGRDETESSLGFLVTIYKRGFPRLKVQGIQRRRRDSHREIKTSRDKRKDVSRQLRSPRHAEQVGLRTPPGDKEEVCQKAPGKEAGEGSSVWWEQVKPKTRTGKTTCESSGIKGSTTHLQSQTGK